MDKVIYQFGSLAGWPHVLAKGLREKGHNSLNIVLDADDSLGTTNGIGKSNRQLKYDEHLYSRNLPFLIKLFKRIMLVIRILRDGKVVHYHGGTILPKNLDVLIFKIFKIPTVISWGGGDARLIDVASKINPYFFRYEEREKDKNIRKMLKRLSSYGIVVATDPEMAIYMKGYFDNVHTFRAPMDLKDLTCVYPDVENKKPVFLHIPTHPFVKGTVHVKHAFKKLKDEGFDFEPRLLDSRFTQAEVRKLISECDVYVDELRCGSYGVTAIEAAGSGKPTLTYILDEVWQKFPPEISFVNTNPDTIYENLKRLILNPAERREIGMKSRKYVEKYHAVDVVTDDMLSLYKSLGQ